MVSLIVTGFVGFAIILSLVVFICIAKMIEFMLKYEEVENVDND